MIKRQVVAIATVAAMLVSCSVMPRGSAPVAAELPEGYSSREAALFYQSEGVKSWVIHHDSSAVRYFSKSIESDSLFAPAYYGIANVYLESSPAEAYKYSLKASEIDSLNLDYRGQLGRLMVINGKYDQALELYKRLVAEDPHNSLNYGMLAALYELRGQPYSAISVLDSAEYKLGRTEALSSYKRRLLIGARLYDKAVEETEALISEYPYEDENYQVLAELYANMGKDSLAKVSYAQALMLDSTNLTTLLSYANFLRGRGSNDDYIATIKRIFEADNIPLDTKKSIYSEIVSSTEYYRANFFAINNLTTTLLRKYPSDYSVMELYATHLIRSGNIEQASELYKSFLSNADAPIEAYLEVLTIESYLKRPDSVFRYSEMALKKFPENVDIYLYYGHSLSYSNNPKEAIKVYKQAYKYASDNAKRSYIMGIIGDTYQRKRGAYTKVCLLYDKALRLDPDNDAVLNNYAYMLGENNASDPPVLEWALKMSERANKISPGNSTFLDTQGWILYKLGRYEEAKKIMMQAISLDSSGSPVLLMHYGDILYELKDYFMAKIYWRRAKDRGYDAGEVEQRLKLPER